MKYRHRVLGLLFLLSIITYLDRVASRSPGPHAGGPEDRSRVVGLGSRCVRDFLRRLRNPSGSMGDRIGPRKVLTRIVLWWSAFTTLTGFAANFQMLLPIRFLSARAKRARTRTAARAFRAGSPRSSAPGARDRLDGEPCRRRHLRPCWWCRSKPATDGARRFYVFGILGVAWAVVWYGWYRDRPPRSRESASPKMEEIGDPPARAHQGLALADCFPQPQFSDVAVDVFHLLLRVFFFLSWLQTYLVRGRGFSEKDLLLSTFHSSWARWRTWPEEFSKRRAGSAQRIEKGPPDDCGHRTERFGAVHRGDAADAKTNTSRWFFWR